MQVMPLQSAHVCHYRARWTLHDYLRYTSARAPSFHFSHLSNHPTQARTLYSSQTLASTKEISVFCKSTSWTSLAAQVHYCTYVDTISHHCPKLRSSVLVEIGPSKLSLAESQLPRILQSRDSVLVFRHLDVGSDTPSSFSRTFKS